MTLRVSVSDLVTRKESSKSPGLIAIDPTWDRVPLGKLARIVNGAAYKSNHFNTDGVGMPLLRIRDVGAKQVGTWYDGPWEVGHLVRRGDLVVGMDGDFKSATWVLEDALLNQRVCRIDVIEDRIDSRFLRLVLPGYLDLIWGATSATTVKHLSSRSIAEIPIPHPPPNQQLQIVEILEDHLSRLEAAADLLNVSRRRAKALRDAIWAELFTPAAGDYSTLGDVALWSSGGTPRAGITKYYHGGEIPWCNSGDLNDSHLGDVPKTITQAGLENSSTKWVPPGSVLIAMYGATIGRVALNDVALTTNQAVAAGRPNSALISADYLFWFLRSQLSAFRSAGKGGAQPNISQSLLKAWPIPLPSHESQRHVVQEAEAADEATSRLRQQIDRMDHSLETIRTSLLRAAFEGRLTGRATERSAIEEMGDV